MFGDIGMSPASSNQLPLKYIPVVLFTSTSRVFPARPFRKISRAALDNQIPNEFSRTFCVPGIIGHYRFRQAPFRSSVESKPYILA